MATSEHYPIGTRGLRWGDAEVAQWRSRQERQRSYEEDVLRRVGALRECFDVMEYGRLAYVPDDYPLFVLKSHDWNSALPNVLVTGGVHGYETSGVHGALKFAEKHGSDYAGRANVMVVPCVSPWGYERIHRWNPQALDPNRSFRAGSQVPEAAALMELVEPLCERFVVHIDLHETTDTDETEFRPALAARDGVEFEPGGIPDGFYVVGDTEDPQPEFQQVIIQAVSQVTHIAPADENGEIIGSPVVAPGVINYALRELGLCAGITKARYRTTTEVYPDSPRVTPEQCNEAQVVAARAAIDFALASRGSQ